MVFRRIRMPFSSILVVCLLIISMWLGVISIVPEPVLGGKDHNNEIISTDVTWLAVDNPHNISGTLIILGGNLTLEPGVIVKINTSVSSSILITSNGRLNANGTSGNPIIITSNSSSPAKADWNGITINSNCIGYFNYCSINFSSTGIIDSSSEAYIENSTFYNCTTGIQFSGNINPNFVNNNISDCTTGIGIIGNAAPTIYNNTINGSSTTTGISLGTSGITNVFDNDIEVNGISALGISITGSSSSNIYENTIIDTPTGISISSGSSAIFNNTIENSGNAGISISAGSPEIYNNSVSNSSTGIEISGSTAKVHHNEVFLCQKGALLKATSNFKFYNNTLDSCLDSFYTENTATVQNCTIINSTRFNFNLQNANNHDIYTINMSYNDTNSVESTCNLYKQWFVHGYVKDNFDAPINNARITIVPNGSTQGGNYFTAMDGWVRWIKVTEKIYTNSGQTMKTPHNTLAWKQGYNTNQSTVTIIKSLTIIFSIQDIESPSSVLDADRFWYNIPIVNLSFQVTDNSELQNIKLFYNHSTDNITFSAPTETNSSGITGVSDSGIFGFNFTASDGEGYYKFYTIADDKNSNTEAIPKAGNTMVLLGFDVTPPEIIGFESTNITEDSLVPCTVNATIEDSLSGLDGVPLIRVKYDSTSAVWDINYTAMIAYSRDANVRDQTAFYYNIPYPATSWDEYQNKSIAWQVKCVDFAGNEIETAMDEQAKEFVDFVDNAPSILLKAPVSNKWYNHTVLIRTEANDNDNMDDPLYGIAEVQAQYSLNSTNGLDGNWTNCSAPDSIYPYDISWSSELVIGTNEMVWLRVRSKDYGGLHSPWKTVKIKVDNEPANSTHDYEQKWRNTDFVINLSALDRNIFGTNGTGVMNIYYKINGGAALNIETNGMPKISLEGKDNTLEFWSIDNQNNVEKHNLVENIQLDKTKPIISNARVNNITKQTSNTAEVWFNANISDEPSGLKDIPKFRLKFPDETAYGEWKTMENVAGIKYRGQLELPLNKIWLMYSGEDIQIEIRAVDLAGNAIVEPLKELVDDIGTNAPVIVHTPEDSAYDYEDIIITAKVTDNEVVKEVRLFYKGVGDTEFISVIMVGGDDDIYSTTISAQLKEGLVHYYIRAEDNKQNFASDPEFDPETHAYVIEISFRDLDSDKLPDWWEISYFGDYEKYSGNDDPDGDGLSNLAEYNNSLIPDNEDSDGDYIPDGWELHYGLDPSDNTGVNGKDGDPDNDTYTNYEEYKADTDPYDPRDKPKDEQPQDNLATYSVIVVVIIIVILIIAYLVLRGRSELGGKPIKDDKARGKRDDFESDDEEDDDDDDDDDDDKLDKRPGKGKGKPSKKGAKKSGKAKSAAILKPAAQTISLEKKLESVTLEKGLLCEVCQGAMRIGDTAVKCKCGLLSHGACATDVKRCPVCKTDFNTIRIGFTVAEMDSKVIPKPIIHQEIKYKIEELVNPPEKAYFAYVPKKIEEAKIQTFLNGYYDTRELGPSASNKIMKTDVSFFMTPTAAKKMFDHCYEQGREKEVMGLIIGKTYQYEDKVISIARDVVTSDLEASEVNVKFDNFEKLFDQLDGIRYEYQLLGWYHSHPTFSSFMSPTDIDTQKRMFKHPHQYGVVIDPVKYDLKAFVLNQKNNDKVIESGYAIIDFRE